MSVEHINSCEIKVGLLVLRSCTRIPRYKCAECSKTICKRHTHEVAQVALCPNCAAARRKDEEWEDDWDDDGFYEDDYYDLWYHHSREDFYTRTRYTPIVAADYEGFERQGQQDLYADNDLGSFFDS